MDSNHRYRIRNNPFWLPPFGPSPMPTKSLRSGKMKPCGLGLTAHASSEYPSANLLAGVDTVRPSALETQQKLLSLWPDTPSAPQCAGQRPNLVT
jgi:hypothetical protein